MYIYCGVSYVSLLLISITWITEDVCFLMIDVNRTVEVLCFRGFIGVTTAAYWEVLAICWPSLIELTKSGFFCLCIWVIVSVSNRAGRQAATVSIWGEAAEQAEEHRGMAGVWCKSPSSWPECAGADKAAGVGASSALVWQGSAEPCKQGAAAAAPGVPWHRRSWRGE